MVEVDGHRPERPGRRDRARRAVMSALLLALCLGAAAPALGQTQHRYANGEWVAVETPQPGTPEGELHEIRQTLARDQGKQAQKLATTWIRTHPGHELMAEAYLLRADAKVARRHYYEALYDYERLIHEFPQSPAYHTALEREFEIAQLFAAGMNRRWLGMRLLPATSEAEEIFIRIQERAPGSELGEKAHLALADFFYRQGEMVSAAETYGLFLENYPDSAHREKVLLRLIESNMARFNGPDYDARGLADAIRWIEQYQREYPAAAERMGAEALLVRVRESLALKELHTARWYDRRGQDVSAAYSYQRLVRDYPRTAAAQMAIRRLQAMGAPAVAAPPESTPAPTPEEPAQPASPTTPAEPAAASEPAGPPAPAAPLEGEVVP